MHDMQKKQFDERSIVTDLYDISEELMLGGMHQEAIQCVEIASRAVSNPVIANSNGDSKVYTDLENVSGLAVTGDIDEQYPEVERDQVEEIRQEEHEEAKRQGLDLLFENVRDVDVELLPDFDCKVGSKKHEILELLGTDPVSWFTSVDIENELGFSDKTITAHLSELQDTLWVKRRPNEDNTNCRYRYTATDELAAKFSPVDTAGQ